MCLILFDTEIKVAKEDIICYKVMEKRDDDLISPYQNMRYEYGRAYVTETPIIVKYGIATRGYIEEGFHSFLKKEDAQYFASNLQTWLYLPVKPRNHQVGMECNPKVVIVKCLIPAGTRYAAGFFCEFGKSFDSFCSERIIVLEEVI